MTLAPVIAIPIAVVAAAAAGGIWCALLRPVPSRTASGTINAHGFVDVREMGRTRIRSVRTPEQLTRQECYSVARHRLSALRLDDGQWLNFTEHFAPEAIMSTYRVGEAVEPSYTARRIPSRDHKLLVSEVGQRP